MITSGGGFSTFFPQPEWQSSAVSSYFRQVSVQPKSGFNQKGRAIPDVSLVGVYYPVVIGGSAFYIFGTSASTPVFAGMISLINAARFSQGLPSVGFINPILYSANLSSVCSFSFGTDLEVMLSSDISGAFSRHHNWR